MDNHFEAAQYSTDYTDRCGNCHEFLGKEDRFCRYCGTRRGEGKRAAQRQKQQKHDWLCQFFHNGLLNFGFAVILLAQRPVIHKKAPDASASGKKMWGNTISL